MSLPLRALRLLPVPTRRLFSSLPSSSSSAFSSSRSSSNRYSNRNSLPLLPTLAALAAAGSIPALADASPDSTPSHDWSSLVRSLRKAQHTTPSGTCLKATRAPQPSSSLHAHHIEFPLSINGDPYAILSSLLAVFAPASSSSHISVDESPSRRTTTVHVPHNFKFSVSVPRVSSLDGRVSIQLFRPEQSCFSHAEVDALVTAYRLAQTPTTLGYGLFDGKHAVDIGPPTKKQIPPSKRSDSPVTPYTPGPPPPSRPRLRLDDEDEDEKEASDDGEHVYTLDDDPSGVASEQVAQKHARRKLKDLGVDVIDPSDTLTWDSLAGYTDVKQRIDETLVLPLRHPQVYQRIAQGTRARFECNVPKAVLYEGPPGCGKTLSARILAARVDVPFVHIRVETLLSKFYGETTKKLAEVLETANKLGRCIVFLDECDSVGLRRSGGGQDVHEVTRRTLSVLLRFIDGMDGAKDAIILAATNHKDDLDPALVSRFDVVVSFPLPDEMSRRAVLKIYAKQLSEEDLARVARMTWGFSGRELLDVCEEAERMRAGEIVRAREGLGEGDGVEEEGELPGVDKYVEAVERKADHVVGRWDRRFGNLSHGRGGGERDVPTEMEA